jgi:hypothetical protein
MSFFHDRMAPRTTLSPISMQLVYGALDRLRSNQGELIPT